MKMENFLIANVRLLSVKSKINKLNKKYFATVRSDWEQKKYDENLCNFTWFWRFNCKSWLRLS